MNNADLGPQLLLYVFMNTGQGMAAADVSGTLALIEKSMNSDWAAPNSPASAPLILTA